MKGEEKKKTFLRQQQEKPIKFRLGDYNGSYKPNDITHIKHEIEEESLDPTRRSRIICYLLHTRGKLGGTKLNKIPHKEKTEFIAYTLFLEAGNPHKINK